MSSELLEQAIIDAAALKEVAIKNAENALIEKYSQEFNQTVQRLLEQEEIAPVDPNAQQAAPPPADPNAQPAQQPVADPLMADPMAAVPDMSLDGTGGKDAFSKVPGSFSDVSEDQMVTINFDPLRATLNEMLGERYDTGLLQDSTNDALGAGAADAAVVEEEFEDAPKHEEEIELSAAEETAAEPSGEEHTAVLATSELEGDDEDLGGINVVIGDEEQELEWELEEADAPAPEAPAVNTTPAPSNVTQQTGNADKARIQGEISALKTKLNIAQTQNNEQEIININNRIAELEKLVGKAEEKIAAGANAAAAQGVKETVQLTEEELEELAEELRVDLKIGNLSDGYMGSTETQKREQRNLELAAARDSKAAAERAAEKEAMGDLLKENKDLKVMNNKLLSALEQFKTQLEDSNLLNAKLLYTNKALGNISLNERQKNQIVESISKADSVLAAKTIYETLQNAVENTVKEKETPQTLREAINRAATPFVVRKSSANSVNDLQAERLKALAGIKTNK